MHAYLMLKNFTALRKQLCGGYSLYLQSLLVRIFISCHKIGNINRGLFVDPDGRVIKCLGLRQFDCWGCGFESIDVIDFHLFYFLVLCRWRYLRRTDHSSRGGLPCVCVCVCVCVCDLETWTVSRLRPGFSCCTAETNRGLGIEIVLIPGINFVKIKVSIANIFSV